MDVTSGDVKSAPLAAVKTPVVEARGLAKRFGRVVALDHADLELRPGEVLGLIGDNGAGKSVLIKTISGAVIPDEGEILIDGKVMHFRSPLDARAAGIETVYQDLALSPALSIATNIFLGRELRVAGPADKWLTWRKRVDLLSLHLRWSDRPAIAERPWHCR